MSSMEAAAVASSAVSATEKVDSAAANPQQPHKFDSSGVSAWSGGHVAVLPGTQIGPCMQLPPQQADAGIAPADANSAASPQNHPQMAIPQPHQNCRQSRLQDGAAAMSGPQLHPSAGPAEGPSSNFPQQLPSPPPAEQQVIITAAGPARDAEQRPWQGLRTSQNSQQEAERHSLQQEWDEPCLTQLATGGGDGAAHSLSQVADPRPT